MVCKCITLIDYNKIIIYNVFLKQVFNSFLRCYSFQIAGETEKESGLAGKKTIETVKAVSKPEDLVNSECCV